jgi:hypothetical protein
MNPTVKQCLGNPGGLLGERGPKYGVLWVLTAPEAPDEGASSWTPEAWVVDLDRAQSFLPDGDFKDPLEAQVARLQLWLDLWIGFHEQHSAHGPGPIVTRLVALPEPRSAEDRQTVKAHIGRAVVLKRGMRVRVLSGPLRGRQGVLEPATAGWHVVVPPGSVELPGAERPTSYYRPHALVWVADDETIRGSCELVQGSYL